MADAKINAALYARVSTDDQDVGMQLRELREEAEQRGWVILDEYIDAGVSGRKNSRPELDRMMDDIERGRFDAVSAESEREVGSNGFETERLGTVEGRIDE